MALEVIRIGDELNFDMGWHHGSASRETWKTHFTASAFVEDPADFVAGSHVRSGKLNDQPINIPFRKICYGKI